MAPFRPPIQGLVYYASGPGVGTAAALSLSPARPESLDQSPATPHDRRRRTSSCDPCSMLASFTEPIPEGLLWQPNVPLSTLLITSGARLKSSKPATASPPTAKPSASPYGLCSG